MQKLSLLFFLIFKPCSLLFCRADKEPGIAFYCSMAADTIPNLPLFLNCSIQSKLEPEPVATFGIISRLLVHHGDCRQIFIWGVFIFYYKLPQGRLPAFPSIA